MHRRNLLKAGSAFAVAPLLWSWTARGQGGPPTRFIDVHCHTFNANDLPIEKFAEKIMLPDLLSALKRKGTSKFLLDLIKSHEESEQLLITVLGGVMRKATPSLNEETAALANNQKTLTQQQLVAFNAPDEIDNIKRVLKWVWDPEKSDKDLYKVGDHYFGHIALNELRARIRKEAFQISDAEAYAPPNADDENYLSLVAKNLYYDLGPGPNYVIGYMMRWALRFSRYHFELVDELSNMHGGRLTLMTPALVDFDLWLAKPDWTEEKKQRTRLVDLVKVMASVAQRKEGPHVHGFVSFDPLRQAFFTLRHGKGTEENPSPFSIVESAINKNGFIGVKLYPAMGFSPIRNRKIDKLPAWVKDKKSGLGSLAGEKMDTELLDLFDWCQKNNVPVMAHANNSNQSHVGYGARGSPDMWHRLLQSKQKGGFMNLRINLGHFGGFEEIFYNSIGKETLEETWEWKILKIWKGLPQAKLYADISFLNEILPSIFPVEKEEEETYRKTRKRVTDLWKKHVVPVPVTAERLMYGTDWMMTGGDVGFPSYAPAGKLPDKFYPDLVADFLKEVGYDAKQIDQILFKNAIDYLGLKSAAENGTRQRLEKFHAGNADWLKAFD